jgi:hypothetical protein
MEKAVKRKSSTSFQLLFKIHDLLFTVFVGRREIRDGRSEAVIEPAFTGG